MGAASLPLCMALLHTWHALAEQIGKERLRCGGKLKWTPFCLWPLWMSLPPFFIDWGILKERLSWVLPWVSPVVLGQNSDVVGAQSPYRMVSRFNQLSLSTCSSPWTYCTMACRGCGEDMVQSTWPFASLLRTLLLQDISLSPVIFYLDAAVALAVLAKTGPLFLLGLNGRRPSEWLEWGPMVNDPREGSAGHEGGICNIWQRERDTWVNVFEALYFPDQFESH